MILTLAGWRPGLTTKLRVVSSYTFPYLSPSVKGRQLSLHESLRSAPAWTSPRSHLLVIRILFVQISLSLSLSTCCRLSKVIGTRWRAVSAVKHLQSYCYFVVSKCKLKATLTANACSAEHEHGRKKRNLQDVCTSEHETQKRWRDPRLTKLIETRIASLFLSWWRTQYIQLPHNEYLCSNLQTTEMCRWDVVTLL